MRFSQRDASGILNVEGVDMVDRVSEYHSFTNTTTASSPTVIGRTAFLLQRLSGGGGHEVRITNIMLTHVSKHSKHPNNIH